MLNGNILHAIYEQYGFRKNELLLQYVELFIKQHTISCGSHFGELPYFLDMIGNHDISLLLLVPLRLGDRSKHLCVWQLIKSR